MKEVLENLKIIDLCRSYPPAFASACLADFGADVVRVDTPGFTLPIPVKGASEKLSAYYFLDRNKRALSLNLKSERGVEIFHKLAKRSDVIIENSKPGTMESLGIGYPVIKELNPRIIYCSVSGFGQNGPYSMRPGHDSNYLGLTGALSFLGEKDGPPIIPGNIIADMAGAAMHSLVAILIALLARENTGKGQFIDISYTDSVFSLLTFHTAMYFLNGIVLRRGENFLTGSEPFLANYKTKDGNYLNVACIEHRLWKNLCQELGCDQFIPFQWTEDQKIKKKIFSYLEKSFLKKTRDEWWDWAQDKDVAVAPVLDLEEAMKDPQILHRKMIMELDHPTLGKIKQIGSPFKLTETPPTMRRFSPTPGQDTAEILKELGYDDQER